MTRRSAKPCAVVRALCTAIAYVANANVFFTHEYAYASLAVGNITISLLFKTIVTITLFISFFYIRMFKNKYVVYAGILFISLFAIAGLFKGLTTATLTASQRAMIAQAEAQKALIKAKQSSCKYIGTLYNDCYDNENKGNSASCSALHIQQDNFVKDYGTEEYIECPTMAMIEKSDNDFIEKAKAANITMVTDPQDPLFRGDE